MKCQHEPCDRNHDRAEFKAAQQHILDHLHRHRPTRTFNSPDYTGGYQHAIDVIRRIRLGDETGDTT